MPLRCCWSSVLTFYVLSKKELIPCKLAADELLLMLLMSTVVTLQLLEYGQVKGNGSVPLNLGLCCCLIIADL